MLFLLNPKFYVVDISQIVMIDGEVHDKLACCFNTLEGVNNDLRLLCTRKLRKCDAIIEACGIALDIIAGGQIFCGMNT